MGGKGERLAQCSEVNVLTYKAIPMQVPMLRREKKLAFIANLARRNTRHERKDSQAQSTSVIVQISINVVARLDYDTYKDSFERLKNTGFEIGVINLESECDLDVARVLIQKLLDDHPCLPYEPSKDWRFLDCEHLKLYVKKSSPIFADITNAEEGTFRVPRAQEHVHSISDISNPDDCLLILDDVFPSITASDASLQQQSIMQRRIRETLRIVLSSDAEETHL
uniref:Septin-type G domain-containing protein n=1 Tax=Angiostrongylus cantonensis TaxID=6313 RepID=A0A0K0CXM5_ANGCA